MEFSEPPPKQATIGVLSPEGSSFLKCRPIFRAIIFVALLSGVDHPDKPMFPQVSVATEARVQKSFDARDIAQV